MNEKNETILTTRGSTVIVWRTGLARPLQMRKGGSIVFSCAPERITSWADASDLARQRAESMWRRAGRVLDDVTKQRMLLADGLDDCWGVLTITTQSVIDAVKPLIPEAIESNRRAKEAAAAAEAERRRAYEERRAAVIAACPADHEPCTLGRWFDGIQAYIAPDGTEFDGWDGKDDHGCGIVYIDKATVAEASARAAERAKADAAIAAERQAREEQERRDREAAFAKARETGERQPLRKWVTDRCMNGNDDDCSFDSAVEWAMPDGTAKTTYTCCF